MATAITEAEILDALSSALGDKGPDHAMTQEQMARAFGINVKRVRQAMRELQSQGRLRSHRVIRVGLNGISQPVTAYTIQPVMGVLHGES